MVYKWKSASQIKADAQTAGEIFTELHNTVGLTPENLLDASRADEAPLHGEFEWDDNIAAEKYRVEQAGYLIRMLCVEPEAKGAEPTRAFFTVERRTYEPVDVIISNPDKADSLFRTALSELIAFKKKYAALKKLESVFAVIDDIEAKETV